MNIILKNKYKQNTNEPTDKNKKNKYPGSLKANFHLFFVLLFLFKQYPIELKGFINFIFLIFL